MQNSIPDIFTVALGHLAQQLLKSYDKSHFQDELKKTIMIAKVSFQLASDASKNKHIHGHILARALEKQFDHTGDLADIDQAIAVQQDAMQLISDNHTNKPNYLGDFGTFFGNRFKHSGNPSDINQAIAALQNAVQLTPDGDANKPVHLHNLGTSFSFRFDQLKDLSDVDQAIAAYQNAVQLTPDNDTDKPKYLDNLGSSFAKRFKYLGDPADLNQAIAAHKKAVQLASDDHPNKAYHLNNLGTSFLIHFGRFEDLSNIDQAIAAYQNAVQLTPNDHASKPDHLTNLGSSFTKRFEYLNDPADLDQAIAAHQKAVQLASDDHPNKAHHLSDLGSSFLSCFKYFHDIAYVDQAIAAYQKAVQLTPDNHTDKPHYLNNLGNSFGHHFQYLGDLADVDQALAAHQKAVQLTPNNHTSKPSYLNNLGSSFLNRFQHLGNLADVDQAIVACQNAMQLTPDDHANKHIFLSNLGNSFFNRFKHFSDFSDLQKAIIHFSLAAQSSAGSFSMRFNAGRRWVRCAHILQHSSLFQACDITLNLLSKLAWLGLPLSKRYSALTQATGFVRDAAAIAVEHEDYNTAVEWLEQGNSVVWGQQLQLRTSFDDLKAKHSILANEFDQISKQLEQASYRYDTEQKSSEEQAQQHHALAIKWESLLLKIRSMPGFNQFLMPKKLAQLYECAHSGPVIILNCSQLSCDALIIMTGSEDVIHLPLSDLTYNDAFDLGISLNEMLRKDGRRVARLESHLPYSYKFYESILSELWFKVVKPVLDALAYPKQTATSKNLSRIFWCPTGPLTFLPIHAAGIYGTTGPNVKVSEFVISSYTPTLSALILPSEDIIQQNINLLAVAQPSSDGQFSQLPGTQEEISKIKERLSRLNSNQVLLTESNGTVEDVLDKLQKCSWVHFACHGIQDLRNPVNSGLLLANKQRLKLSDVVRVTRPHGGLAFLSACQTATGDKRLADEAVHLAAGMLFIGYGGVIATMWSILDDVAPKVAEDVYSQLFSDDSLPDYRQAARALHYAVEKLQQDPKISSKFYSWLPFVHFGL
ncbi:TPR-like protein [Laetiporus sulphureus 93-53]|uniref:TPR-like protein n=1 Tax=Laetiporus sulphureus 93-53 TaxID=1314785 RepID=A0A165GGA7_9APHY|nr:TPR-like protein [Laetiporus sulphureus 93-53]KZT10306.1 TPR-like protein [Laetiporus sulphureus 93-53]